MRVAHLTFPFLLAAAACGNAQTDATGRDVAHVNERDAEVVFTPLYSATSEDVVKVFGAILQRDLDQAFACHPEIESVSLETLDALTDCSPTVYTDLRDALRQVLAEMNARESGNAQRSDVQAAATEWARAQLDSATRTDGVELDVEKVEHPYLRTAMALAQDQNAFAKAKSPKGIRLQELKRAWFETMSGRGSNAEYGFIYPVVASRAPTLEELEAYFQVESVEYAVGVDAIDDFATAATNDSPAFEALSEMLRLPSIKARHFFLSTMSSSSGSTTKASLYVVDEHHQVYGFWYVASR